MGQYDDGRQRLDEGHVRIVDGCPSFPSLHHTRSAEQARQLDQSHHANYAKDLEIAQLARAAVVACLAEGI